MEQVSTWIGGNADTLVLISACALMCSVVVFPFVLFRPKKIQTGEGNMVTREQWEAAHKSRRQSEKQVIIDAFEDVLLKLWADDKITAIAYQNWHKRLADAFFIEDFKTGSQFLTQSEVKNILKKRRNAGSYYGIYKPVNIPGPKTGEKEVYVKNELHALILKLQPPQE